MVRKTPTCYACGKPGFYACPECEAKREAEECAGRRQVIVDNLDKLVARITRNQGMPDFYQTFTPAGLESILQRTLQGVFKAWDEHRWVGVGFWGTTGGMKTGAAAEGFKEFVRRNLKRLAAGQGFIVGPWPVWKCWPDLLDELREDKRASPHTYAMKMEALIEAPMLVLDDLGAEAKWKDTESSYSGQELYKIINSRSERSKPIIWTSNYDTTKLAADYYEARTISRLSQLARPVRVMAKDHRL
jgi:hypothetical protein